ncbi:MAG: nucleotidyltransferase family protein [Alphaproteobacteria bacterium]|nr:MAG: hypothetical protein B6I23_01090 [Rickettsiaceae bacterium 4572_127]
MQVSKKELEEIKAILEKHLHNKKVLAFGSRIKETADKFSDLDCVVFCANVFDFEQITEAFENSDLPFRIQLLMWEKLPKDFQEEIKKQFVVLQKGRK